MISPLRVVFMGTAELAVPSLMALTRDGRYHLVGVVTQPDRPQGRDLQPRPSRVKTAAQQSGLPVLQPEKLRLPSSVEQLAALAPDLIVVTAYGQILPLSILGLPRWGCLNVHASLLPKHRGAAPIQWALLGRDTHTGVTIMKMDAGLDTGEILTQQSTAILDTDNAQILHDRLALMGADLLVRTIPEYLEGRIVPQPQAAEQATYARKITKQDGLIDWQMSAALLLCRIRAFTPWPGAFTFFNDLDRRILLKICEAQVVQETGGCPGEILRIDPQGIIVACGEKALNIRTLQREGKRKMKAQEFLLGARLTAGQRLFSIQNSG